jgi:DNA modification methylase
MSEVCSSVRTNDYILFNEDCLKTAGRFPEECIDLIYVDPPFCSGRKYSMNGYGFDDRWDNLEGYIEWIKLRLAEFQRILKRTGSIYIHCDWHISHYLKVLADSIFNRKNFLNEIVWKRQSSHNDVQQGSRHFGRIHDTILVYSKSDEYIWNQQYLPYDEHYVDHNYRHVESGTERRYALGDLSGPGGAAKGNPYYEFLGVTQYWRYSKTKMFDLLARGKIVHKEGNVPVMKRYLDEMKGKPIQDIWTDISLDQSQKIRFPTQKPERLLERIVNTSSNPNQIIYDPFSGSATSGAVCYKLSRGWIGSEILKDACSLALERLEASGCKVKLYLKDENEMDSQMPLPRSIECLQECV